MSPEASEWPRTEPTGLIFAPHLCFFLPSLLREVVLVPWAELTHMGSWCLRKPLSRVSVTLSSSSTEPSATEWANDRCLLDEAGGGSRAWSLKVRPELPGREGGGRHFRSRREHRKGQGAGKRERSAGCGPRSARPPLATLSGLQHVPCGVSPPVSHSQ